MPAWAARMLARNGQSAPDGSLSAAMGAFSPEANSGDMYMPEHRSTGKPIKCIAGQQRKGNVDVRYGQRRECVVVV